MEKAPVEASQLIDDKIASLPDWRGETLRQIREIVLSALPGITEELKWRGTPVWSKNGILCTGEVYRDVVKVTFAQGAKLSDPAGLFNASLDGNTRRAIDFHRGDPVDREGLTALVLQAAASHKPSR